MDTRVSSSTQASHKHPTISDFLRNFEMFSADARDKAKYREILDWRTSWHMYTYLSINFPQSKQIGEKLQESFPRWYITNMNQRSPCPEEANYNWTGCRYK